MFNNSLFHQIFFVITAYMIVWLGYTHIQIGSVFSGSCVIAYAVLFIYVVLNA